MVCRLLWWILFGSHESDFLWNSLDKRYDSLKASKLKTDFNDFNCIWLTFLYSQANALCYISCTMYGWPLHAVCNTTDHSTGELILLVACTASTSICVWPLSRSFHLVVSTLGRVCTQKQDSLCQQVILTLYCKRLIGAIVLHTLFHHGTKSMPDLWWKKFCMIICIHTSTVNKNNLFWLSYFTKNTVSHLTSSCSRPA